MANVIEIAKASITAYNDKDWTKAKDMLAADAVYDDRSASLLLFLDPKRQLGDVCYFAAVRSKQTSANAPTNDASAARQTAHGVQRAP